MAPAADHVADLLRKLSLDPKGVVAGQGREVQNKVSAAPNGRLNSLVASLNPQVSSTGQWPGMGQQGYKNANMYGAGADAYQYYYGGRGDYSVYVGLDGAESLNPGVYGNMYCYPQYGVASSGYDGKMYGSQHYQYPSTYHQPQTTSTTKPAYNPKAGKSDPLPQKGASAAPTAYQQPGLLDASKANSTSTDSSTGLKKMTYPVKPSGRSASYQNHGDRAAYPSYAGQTQ